MTRWLYIIYSFMTNIKYSIVRPSVSTYIINCEGTKQGIDERFPIEQRDQTTDQTTDQTDQIYNISLFMHYLEQIKRIEKYSFPNIEEAKADTVVSDLFPGISRIRLKAGGLMDDWERNDWERNDWERNDWERNDWERNDWERNE